MKSSDKMLEMTVIALVNISWKSLCGQRKCEERNRVTSELRRAVENYFCNLIEENSNSPKEMWKTINKVLNKSQCSTTPRSVKLWKHLRLVSI